MLLFFSANKWYRAGVIIAAVRNSPLFFFNQGRRKRYICLVISIIINMFKFS